MATGIGQTQSLGHSARRDLAEEIEKGLFGQFLLSRQGERLKNYAHDRGVLLVGDLPFFVSLDSSDVWANPECFELDANLRPRFVAGVPRIISAPRDSFGATRCTTGKPFSALVIVGASTD
jgi:4-alpha-glucanotransferase